MSCAHEVLSLYGTLLRKQHVSLGVRAGLSPSQLAVIKDTTTALSDDVDPASVLTPVQKACLIYTDWMTRNIQVPQRVFDALRAVLSDQKVVEVTSTVGTYNMVSRFLVALDVGDMASVSVSDLDE